MNRQALLDSWGGEGVLRFIIRRKLKDQNTGLERELMETVDIQCHELEQILTGGGLSETGHDYREVAGIEILPAECR